MRNPYPFSTPGVVVAGTPWTTLLSIPFGDAAYDAYWFEVANIGPGTLEDFRVQGQVHPDSGYTTLISGSQFDTAAGVLAFATAIGPHEIAAGESAAVRLNLGSLAGLRFQAKTVSGSASLTLRGRASA